MTTALMPVRPDGLLYRIGRSPDPWAWPDWAFAAPDGTFGNRFDDPDSSYRVLYASSRRRGPFLETLARFRPDPHLLEVQIAGDERDAERPTSTPGTLPSTWLAARRIGSARIGEIFADIGHSHSLAFLRERMASRLVHYRLSDLDAAAIRISAPRALTQEISREVYENDEPAFAGIRYASRLGDDIVNWAIFEPAEPVRTTSDAIAPEDPDLLAVLELFGLRLAP